jgi:hypothetical protein
LLQILELLLLELDYTLRYMMRVESHLKLIPVDGVGFFMKLVTTAPILAQPDIEKPFDVYYDASGTGIRDILMQDGYAIAYVS